MIREEQEPVELEINVDTVRWIIEKAREFDEKVAPAEPHSGSNPSDDNESEILEDYSDDATGQELRAAINRLDEDESVDLIALTWVGRGDFDRTTWQEARDLARERHRPQSARYLMGIPNLGDCLEEGLDALGYEAEE
ncbi:hypothetical protein CWB41_10015 [Methylovirgula ligni]|uniref:Uncharacterized protein DUF3775 n=1 Tax=Methylovirgula ligni TaxID=569860 RepID=A0A3D9YUY8_9HYPH|nr:DUF3775 domain-containing protein [Methylovirgula ligni]QAY96024.1 hypothetical protein CWB41_10015 [Methylovirgula ligni]REF86304.1 uncharacterized protein DUF3775 [Methylovirgula ligni]